MVASKSGWQLPKCYLSCRLEQAASSVASASAKSPLTDSMHRWRQGGVARVRSSDSQRKNHRGQGRGARGRTHAGTRGHGRAHTQRRARTSTQQTRRPSPHRKTSTNSAPSKDAAEPRTQRTGPSTRKGRQPKFTEHWVFTPSLKIPRKKSQGFTPKICSNLRVKFFPPLHRHPAVQVARQRRGGAS